MPKLKIEDFKSIKEDYAKKHKNWVRVGMSTCGIAAGAKEVYDLFSSEIEKRNIDVAVRKSGCLGACYAEPLVEVYMEGMPTIVYGGVKKETVLRIIEDHILHGKILSDYVYQLNVAG
jgi:NADH-quinone oxidoreductase subunit F